MGTEDRAVIAAFDFDGTLTRRDSLLPFLRFALSPLDFSWRAARLSPVLMGYAFRLLSNNQAKERVLAGFFAGDHITRIDALGSEFAARRLPSLLLGEAMARVSWHRERGHTCVLVSASLAHYLEPWAKGAGFDHVIASRLEVDPAGRVTGRLAGGNCHGAEKARRLRQLLGGDAGYVLYAYGDSRGDREMLAMADFPYFRRMPGGEDR